jgi:hypothetical protein
VAHSDGDVKGSSILWSRTPLYLCFLTHGLLFWGYILSSKKKEVMKEKKVRIIPPIDFMEERRLAETRRPRVYKKKVKQINNIFKGK